MTKDLCMLYASTTSHCFVNHTVLLFEDRTRHCVIYTAGSFATTNSI
uniref:Uncharacterized protein n=1 Tax=Anguilla anguilla TaxID=7936 RepID=A0A0E9SBV8_ANGAN